MSDISWKMGVRTKKLPIWLEILIPMHYKHQFYLFRNIEITRLIAYC